jgi:uncharacterized membrane protein
MLSLAAAAGIFVLLHLFPSTPWRRAAVARIGEGAYLGVFSLLSIASIAWVATAFQNASYGDKLWVMPEAWLWIKAAVLLLALVLITAGYLTPNPSMVGSAKAVQRPDSANGIFAITRHPLMWGVGIWAGTHLLSQATWRGVIFFGGLAIVALLGSWLQERRKRKELGAAWAEFERRTSFVPFAALVEGRAKFSFAALGWWRVALAFLSWAALLHFHDLLFGVQPLPIGS